MRRAILVAGGLFVLWGYGTESAADAPVASGTGDKWQDACSAPALLVRYVEFGMVARTAAGRIRLKLDANLHGIDCGAPDCYGTRLEVDLSVKAQGTRCVLGGIKVRSREHIECSDAPLGPEDRKAMTPRRRRFVVSPAAQSIWRRRN
jgi:hypothetical protein